MVRRLPSHLTDPSVDTCVPSSKRGEAARAPSRGYTPSVATPTYSVYVRFRKSRLALLRGIRSLETAMTFAAEVRATRFHDPENVFIVDDQSGTIVDERPPIARARGGAPHEPSSNARPSTANGQDAEMDAITTELQELLVGLPQATDERRDAVVARILDLVHRAIAHGSPAKAGGGSAPDAA